MGEGCHRLESERHNLELKRARLKSPSAFQLLRLLRVCLLPYEIFWIVQAPSFLRLIAKTGQADLGAGSPSAWRHAAAALCWFESHRCWCLSSTMRLFVCNCIDIKYSLAPHLQKGTDSAGPGRGSWLKKPLQGHKAICLSNLDPGKKDWMEEIDGVRA